MPETRLERAVFVLGVVAIAALGFLVAHLWHHTRGVTAAPSTSLSPPAPTTSETRPATSSPATTAARPTTRARTTTPANTRPQTAATSSAAGQVSLLLTAKSDTWLEIRTSTSAGSLLYSGTLAAGSTKHFHGRSFWARFGAAGNIFVRLGGKVIRLPSGTYDATFDTHGFRRVGA